MGKNGSYVQDRGPPLCLARGTKPGQAFASEFGGGEEIDLHNPPKPLFTRLIKTTYRPRTRVVDEHIQFSPMSVDPVNHGMAVERVRQITRERLERTRALAALPFQVLQAIFSPSSREDMGPALNKFPTQGSTNSTGTARDEHLGIDQ